jgi:hypothetical protein
LELSLTKVKSLAGAKFDAVIVGALDAAITSGKLRLTAVEVQV